MGCAGGRYCGAQSPDGCSCASGCTETAPVSDPRRCCVDYDSTCAQGRTVAQFMDPCPVFADNCLKQGAATLFCQQYGRRGTHCTRYCRSNADCPAPSRGCNSHQVHFCSGPLLPTNN
jgi:hypothetical protein